MRPLETIRRRSRRSSGRGPGTDAERRAARWLAGELDGRPPPGPDRDVLVPAELGARARVARRAGARRQPGLGRVDPTVGAVLLAVALASIDRRRARRDLARTPTDPRAREPERRGQGTPARRLRSARRAERRAASDHHRQLRRRPDRPRLPRRGPRRPPPASNRATGGRGPGWLAWLAIAIACAAAIAIVRAHAARTSRPPSASSSSRRRWRSSSALALLLEVAGADYGPAAGDNGSGVAVAIALTRALARRPAPQPDRRARAPGRRRRRRDRTPAIPASPQARAQDAPTRSCSGSPPSGAGHVRPGGSATAGWFRSATRRSLCERSRARAPDATPAPRPRRHAGPAGARSPACRRSRSAASTSRGLAPRSHQRKRHRRTAIDEAALDRDRRASD